MCASGVLRRFAFRSLVSVVMTAAPALAGPLTPPPGPITSTHKTLTEVEPRIPINSANTPGDANSTFRIAQPGSYYLAGNIIGSAGKHGIEVAASGVTIDLNGFELDGTPAGTLDGINVPGGGPLNLTIINGSVRAWGNAGINLAAANSTRVEGIVAASNAGDGIRAGGYAVIARCSAYNNAGAGISVGFGGSITNSTSASNTGTGISLGSGSSVSQCASIFGGANGVASGVNCIVTHCTISNCSADGVRAGGTTSVIGCVVGENGGDGIECSFGCFIQNNSCGFNGVSAVAAGIHVTGSNCRIEGNNCTGNDFGIDVDSAGNVITKNTCADNTQNFVLVPDKIHGTIADRTAPGSPAVVGNSAAGTMGSNDPNANYSY